MSKKDDLLIWASKQERFRTSAVIEWGIVNYCNNAQRHARKLREEGLLRRLSKWEKQFNGYDTKEDIYTITQEGDNAAQKIVQKTLF